jgi:hypothetical protein
MEMEKHQRLHQVEQAHDLFNLSQVAMDLCRLMRRKREKDSNGNGS